MAVPLYKIVDSSEDIGSPHSVHTTLEKSALKQLSKAMIFGSVVICWESGEVDWLESWDSSLGTYEQSLSVLSGLGGGEGVDASDVSWSFFGELINAVSNGCAGITGIWR